MDVVCQQCDACGSCEVLNFVVTEPGESGTVYVQCASCRQLVARFSFSSLYQHGRSFESWLRSMGPAAAESGRDFHGEFDRVRQAALDGFSEVLDTVRTDGSGPEMSADTNFTEQPESD